MQEKHLNISNSIRQLGQRQFLDAISQFDGSIDLVWDGKKLMRQLNLIITPKLLTEHTNVAKNFSLEVAGQSKAANTLFLLYPTQRSVELLVKNWLENRNEEESSTSQHIFFIPEESYTLRERLKSNPKIWSRISTVRSLPLHWFPTEHSSLVQMDLPQLPTKMLVDGDWNFIYLCAKSLRNLIGQFKFARIPNFYCKGEWSARIADIMRKLPEKLELKTAETLQSSGGGDFHCIKNVVIIDRWIDPLCPMMKQFTFAGALDEFFGIDSMAMIKVPLDELEEVESSEEQSSQSIQSTTATKEMKEIQLNDEIFKHLQNLSVTNVAFKLREIVDELKEEEHQRRTLASLAEYKNFVAKLPNVVVKRKSTGMFMRLAGILQRYEANDFHRGIVKCEQEILKNAQSDKVHPFIENALIQAKDKMALIRLIILQSLCSPRGLKPPVMQTYFRLIVQSYGISELRWLLKLQLAGLLRDENFADGRLETRYSILNFAQLKKKYKLPLGDINEMRRSDLATPEGRPSMLVRALEDGLANNFSDFTRVSMETIMERENLNEPAEMNTQQSKMAQTLVFVVGGITRDEMAMLHYLPQSHRVICCTTAFLNANTLLSTFHD